MKNAKNWYVHFLKGDKKMKKVAIQVPQEAFPKKDIEHPCPCQFRPIDLTRKKGIVIWLKEVGEYVAKDEVICEAEVEKKSLEFLAPCAGILCEICITNEEQFIHQDILGYIEKEKE